MALPLILLVPSPKAWLSSSEVQALAKSRGSSCGPVPCPGVLVQHPVGPPTQAWLKRQISAARALRTRTPGPAQPVLSLGFEKHCDLPVPTLSWHPCNPDCWQTRTSNHLATSPVLRPGRLPLPFRECSARSSRCQHISPSRLPAWQHLGLSCPHGPPAITGGHTNLPTQPGPYYINIPWNFLPNKINCPWTYGFFIPFL